MCYTSWNLPSIKQFGITCKLFQVKLNPDSVLDWFCGMLLDRIYILSFTQSPLRGFVFSNAESGLKKAVLKNMENSLFFS